MKKLLILCGGQSSEHIVSRMSCTSCIKEILVGDLYDITLSGVLIRWNLVYFRSKSRRSSKRHMVK